MNEYNLGHGVVLMGGIGIAMQGYYRVQVVNPFKEVVADYGWHHNLILNNGMDAVSTAGLAHLSDYGIAGTGSRPNSITSSTSQITQSGNAIFMSDTSGLSDFTSSFSTYTSSVNKGDIIVDSDNSQSTVITVVDRYNLTVDTNYTYTSGKTFTIWKTSQAGLEREIKRSSTYLVGSSSAVGFNCGTITSGSTKMFRRTYDFSAEVAQKDYSEVGCAWTVTANGGAFSRMVLPQTVSVPAGSQLRMTYDLFISFTPNYSRYVEPTIVGWTNTKGTESIQSFAYADVRTDGGISYGTYGTDRGVLDPSSYHGYNVYYCVGSMSDVGTAPAQFNTYVNRTLGGDNSAGVGAANGMSTYVPGDYFLYKYTNWGVSSGNSDSIRSIAMGTSYTATFPANNGQGHVIVFDVTHSKSNLQIAAAAYKFSWTRILQ